MLAAALAAAAVAAGCSEERKCREVRREARWAVSSYLESLRPAVQDLAEQKAALEATLSREDGVVPAEGGDPRRELAQMAQALPEWRKRVEAVEGVLSELEGTGPVSGDPLEVFTPRDDEVNPQAFQASRSALQAAIDACGGQR
ncbi:MAG TPA: hypothetical protein RMF84_01725 [Polyangiaceae bacterium LLY-WYZ-14_1]|nr:hypothetical protein [Polyangiaceae bacterium LLY-WYZ-14_1]